MVDFTFATLSSWTAPLSLVIQARVPASERVMRNTLACALCLYFRGSTPKWCCPTSNAHETTSSFNGKPQATAFSDKVRVIAAPGQSRLRLAVKRSAAK